MKNIVIAAGYATRLYPLTENFPKPLLQIGESSILGRLIADIDQIDGITEHIIVSNHKFIGHFESWAKEQQTKHPIRLIDDGTETNETRLGAVMDVKFTNSWFDIALEKEAANALIFVDYMNVKDQFAEYIASSKKPLTSIQKLIVKEMFMTSESNPQEEK